MSLRKWIVPLGLLIGAVAFSATYNIANFGNLPVSIIQLPLNLDLVPISGTTSLLANNYPTTRNVTLANFCVGIYAATTLGSAGPITFTVTAANVNTALTVTVATSAISGDYCDNTHTVTEASSVLIGVKAVGSGSVNTAGPMTGFSITER